MTIEINQDSLSGAIGEIFTDENLKAFVYDFYATLPDIEDTPEIGDIYRHILSDEEIYRKFMLYAKGNKFSFIQDDACKSVNLAICLNVFEILSAVEIDKFQDCLGKTRQDVYNSMKNERRREKEGNLWDGLQESIGAGIPVNSRGEIIYMLEKIDEDRYRVYSHDSEIHEVTATGEVISDTNTSSSKIVEYVLQELREQRQEIGKTIQKFKRFQKLFTAQKIEDSYDLRLITTVRQNFEKYAGVTWEKIKGDPKEVRLFRIRLQSYVFF